MWNLGSEDNAHATCTRKDTSAVAALTDLGRTPVTDDAHADLLLVEAPHPVATSLPSRSEAPELDAGSTTGS